MLSHQEYNLHELKDSRRKELIEELYHLGQQIIARETIEQFEAIIFAKEGIYDRLMVSRNSEGEAVALTTVHFNKINYKGKPLIYMRLQAGRLPGYRRKRIGGPFFARSILKIKVKHLFTPLYMLAVAIHPNSYNIACKDWPISYPIYSNHKGGELEEILLFLSEKEGMKKVEPSRKFVRKTGAISVETEEEKINWRNHPSKNIKFFLEQNKDYDKGFGLLFTTKITFISFISLYLRSMKRKHLPHNSAK